VAVENRFILWTAIRRSPLLGFQLRRKAKTRMNTAKHQSEFDLKILQHFPPTQKCLIGVSGGRDSVVLLHQLVHRGYYRLVVCHLNHGLRGRQSTADARFVEKLAQENELLFELGSANVAALARKNKISIETAGREARYGFFAEVARRRKCHTLFLGHHADDLVETFLINLFRGSGTTGLASMREIASRKIGRVPLKIVRPLLGIWRNEIDKYVRDSGVRFREDATNKSLLHLRNRVRRRIIPFLEKEFGRPIRKSIWRAASIAAEEDGFFEELLPRNLSRKTQLNLEPLRGMPLAIQRRLVHDWLSSGQIPNVSFDLVERIRALLDLSNRVAKTNLPGHLHVRRRGGKLFME
jgi:tRNA(Ile)-lysidine synthase